MKVTSSSAMVSYQRDLTRKWPCVAAANTSMATVALTTVKIRCSGPLSPIISNWVLKMNKKGRMAVRML